MNVSLRRSIQQILLAGSTAAFAAGALAAVGQQNPPPGPGHIPDYFGVTPNYATSPQPILTQVVINEGVSGQGAAVTANLDTSGAITSFNINAAGSGYVTPTVTITDQPTGTGALASVVMAGGVTGITLDTNNLGKECTTSSAVTFIDPLGTGSGASATVSGVDANGAITGITITNPGAGYTAATTDSNANPVPGTTFSVACDPNFHATGTVSVASGTPGEITDITIDPQNQGLKYSPSATVTINDAPGGNGLGASASLVVDPSSGTITGFTNIVPGSGYSAGTTVSIQDVATGSGATATAASSGTHLVNGKLGVITGITPGSPGSGYRNPTITISDASATGGSGAVAVATTYDYANDVQTDRIMDVQVLNPGSGYDAHTSVKINGGSGVSPITVTPLIEGGTITGFQEIPSATNPVSNFTGLGSGFKTPIAGSGIKKFVNALPGIPGVSSYVTGPGYTAGANNLGQALPAAVPDTTTFPGSDYYVIAETEYTQKLHTDLPTTHLRGYVQLDDCRQPHGRQPVSGPDYRCPERSTRAYQAGQPAINWRGGQAPRTRRYHLHGCRHY